MALKEKVPFREYAIINKSTKKPTYPCPIRFRDDKHALEYYHFLVKSEKNYRVQRQLDMYRLPGGDKING